MQDFAKNIILWYTKNKRDLPWRKTQNPYKIWVSEVILQQTRINQGISYYSVFITEFPDINTLARAKKDKILRIWQGLGYYNRALNMLFAAKTVVNELNGSFPSDYNQLIRLKGIGDYTASAIASISGNQPYAVVDGNVTRVLSRIFGITNLKRTTFEKEIKATATKLLDKKQPGIFNQALMEFGALQCKSSVPLCKSCIFNEVCYAYIRGQVKDYPPVKKVQPKKERYFHYFVIHDGNYVYIQNRKEKDIWAGLYEFPLLETNRSVSDKLALNTFITENTVDPAVISGSQRPVTFRSILSHQAINLYFHKLELINKENLKGRKWIRIKKKNLNEYAFPSQVIKYLKDQELLTE